MKRSYLLYLAAKITDSSICSPAHRLVQSLYDVCVIFPLSLLWKDKFNTRIRLQRKRNDNFHCLLDPLDLIIAIDNAEENTIVELRDSIEKLRAILPVLGKIEIYSELELQSQSILLRETKTTYELLYDARSIRWQEEAYAAAKSEYHRYKALRAINLILQRNSINASKSGTNNWSSLWPQLLTHMESANCDWSSVDAEMADCETAGEAYSPYFQIHFDWSGKQKLRFDKPARDSFNCSIHQALFFLSIAPGEPLASQSLKIALPRVRELLAVDQYRNSLSRIELFKTQALLRSTSSMASWAQLWINDLQQSLKNPLKKISCVRPWYSLFIYRKVRVCCWQKTDLGELTDQTEYTDFWNGEQAKEIRRDMFNSKFGEVPEKHCPKYCNGKVSSDDFLPSHSNIARSGSQITNLPPHEISIIVDHLCNLRCKMCWIFDDPEYVIALQGYKKMIQKIDAIPGNFHPAVTFIGGEPFFSKNSRALIQEIIDKRKTIRLSFISNMLIWDEALLNKIEAGRIGAWTVSFDGGTKDTYEKIRKNSNFEKVIGNIRKLCEFRYQRSKGMSEAYWNIMVPSILMTSNFREMKFTFELFKNLPVALNFVPIARDYRPKSLEQVFDTRPLQQELLVELIGMKNIVQHRLETVDTWEYEIPIHFLYTEDDNRKKKIELTKNLLDSIESSIAYLVHIIKHEDFRAFDFPLLDFEISANGKVIKKEIS